MMGFYSMSIADNTPTENRTPVSKLRALRPRPLDDRGKNGGKDTPLLG